MLWRQSLLGEKSTTENDRQKVDSSSTGYNTFLLPCCRSTREQEDSGNKWHEGYIYLRTNCGQGVAGTFMLLITRARTHLGSSSLCVILEHAAAGLTGLKGRTCLSVTVLIFICFKLFRHIFNLSIVLLKN